MATDAVSHVSVRTERKSRWWRSGLLIACACGEAPPSGNALGVAGQSSAGNGGVSTGARGGSYVAAVGGGSAGLSTGGTPVSMAGRDNGGAGGGTSSGGSGGAAGAAGAAQTADVDSSTLVGKHLFGYQGWFACPGDGGSNRWVHWFK